MTQVTLGSIAYVATQVCTHFPLFARAAPTQSLPTGISQARFSLSSSATFTRSDAVTDSERFYNSVLLLLEDVDEKQEVGSLLVWWNQFVNCTAVKS
jgi:hypothetical protein